MYRKIPHVRPAHGRLPADENNLVLQGTKQEDTLDYYCGARDYLSRATQMLKAGDQASMFYAAFELR
jgi:hypothetical protein